MASQAHAQKIYKYVDQNGNVSYSTSVPKGMKGQEIKPKYPKGSSSSPTDAKKSEEPDASTDGVNDPEADHARKLAERRKSNCEQARKNLELLDSATVVTIPNANGEEVTLDDEARAAQKQTAQRQIADY